MQTELADFIKDTPQGRDAERILRTCVHCGFCLATCPTYQLLGDEQDSPRGRIYLIKEALEGARPTATLQQHLDRCLTCRACETTCPSGVEYGRLVDIGRELAEREVPRPASSRLTRWMLRKVLPQRRLFGSLVTLGRSVRPLLPRNLAAKLPRELRRAEWPAPVPSARRVLVLEGCVQPALEPSLDPRMAQLLGALGYEVRRTPSAGCCGAVSQHLGAPDEARAHARRNIDAWWPHIEQGADAVLSSASGCGTMLKDYAHLLQDDPAYAHKAARVAALAKDPIELLEAHHDQLEIAAGAPHRIAFQAPCSLQHGQKLGGRVEALLNSLGFELTPVAEAHLCCGSAGTYSLLQPELSEQLRTRKLANLQAASPALIASANIGCMSHLAERAEVPVRHWLELIAAKSNTRV